MLKSLRRLFDASERKLETYVNLVENISDLEKKFSTMSDFELQQQTSRFKKRLEQGETLIDIRCEAFATVREASKRILSMRHYDVQLLGGLVLTDENIAEMATGEGKTLVASLPSYLYALAEKGVHVITVNEYLARRDREQIGRVHEFLGLSVGLNIPMMEPEAKKVAYQA